MLTIFLSFKGREPVRFTGSIEECALQLANARLFPGFVRWEI